MISRSDVDSEFFRKPEVAGMDMNTDYRSPEFRQMVDSYLASDGNQRIPPGYGANVLRSLVPTPKD